jgi:hypothetical protein
MTLTDFNVPYSYMYRKSTSTIFTLIYPSPPAITLPLTWLFYISALQYLSVCLLFSEVLPWYVLYLNQPSLLYYSSLPFPPILYCPIVYIYIYIYTHTHTHRYLSIYLSIYMHLYLYLCLSSTNERKHVIFVFLNLANFT